MIDNPTPIGSESFDQTLDRLISVTKSVCLAALDRCIGCATRTDSYAVPACILQNIYVKAVNAMREVKRCL